MAGRQWVRAGIVVLAGTLAMPPGARARDQDTVMAIMPVFGQLVAWRMPTGFHRANEETHGTHYLFEALRDQETAGAWSQRITLEAEAGAANSDRTPQEFASDIATGFRQRCPDTYYGIELDPPAVDGHEAFVAVAGCGRVAGDKAARGETALIVVVKGAHSYYTLQWFERGRGQDLPPRIDADLWSGRLKELLPVTLCDEVAGERPPYPSCVARIRAHTGPLTTSASRNRRSTDTAEVEARWEAIGFTITLQHYLSTLAAACDAMPGASVPPKGLLRAWQERGRNGVFLDASRMYQTALVTAVRESSGEEAAQRILANQMALVRQQGDDAASRLLDEDPSGRAETCRQARTEVAAGQYDIGQSLPMYATLESLVRELGGNGNGS